MADERGIDKATDSEPSRSIEKVREILFGPRAREAERRLQALEERFDEAVAQVRTEVSDRLDQIEARWRRDIESLEKRQAAADDAVKTSATDAEAQRRAGQAAVQAAHNTLRAEMAGLSTALDTLQQNMREQSHALQSRMVDRQTLASLMIDLAGRLAASDDHV